MHSFAASPSPIWGETERGNEMTDLLTFKFANSEALDEFVDSLRDFGFIKPNQGLRPFDALDHTAAPGGKWPRHMVLDRVHPREDSGIDQRYEITMHYDPMISKLIVWGPTRSEATDNE